MAEHILRHLGGGHFEVYSAGTDPQGVHPLTITVLDDLNIDARAAESKGLGRFLDQQFDYIITVCNRANDHCPSFPGDHRRIHWSFDDPAAVGGDQARLKAFRRVCNEITNRMRIWIAAVDR